MLESSVLNAVSNNRKNLAIIGANLGGQFHQVDVRLNIPNFDDEKARIAAGDNLELFLNRSPKRFRIVSKDIINIGTKSDIDGQPIVYINQNEDGLPEVQIPFSNDMQEFAKINDNALKDALRGDKSKIFADPERLVAQLNALNNKEIKNIEHIIKMLNASKQTIENAITENSKKVIAYKRELGLNTTEDTTVLKVNVDLTKD